MSYRWKEFEHAHTFWPPDHKVLTLKKNIFTDNDPKKSIDDSCKENHSTVEPHFSGIFGHRGFFRSCEDFR